MGLKIGKEKRKLLVVCDRYSNIGPGTYKASRNNIRNIPSYSVPKVIIINNIGI